MAWTAHKTEEAIKEHFDSPEEFNDKVGRLVDLIRASNHFVTFTGAGISTSAGIPDFRGPEGVWTLKAQGRVRTSPTKSVLEAWPTSAHMALVGLQDRGIMKYMITQNCDGLHRKSGILQGNISELHGNCSVEECEGCNTQYMRDFPCYRQRDGRDHFTGRYCDLCHGRLMEWTIDFGQSLPALQLDRAYKHSKKADVMLVLGSSLTVTPAADMPRNASVRGHLIICNLQHTPLDSRADFVIHAKTDDVMKEVMKRLNLVIPPWRLRRRVFITSQIGAGGKWEIAIKGMDPDNDHISASIFSKIEIFCMFTNKDPFSVVLSNEPYSFNSAQKKGTPTVPADVRPVLAIKFHWMMYYDEKPLTIFHDLSHTKVVHALEYYPYDSEWVYTSQTEPTMCSEVVIPRAIPEAPAWVCYTNSDKAPKPCTWPTIFVSSVGTENRLYVVGGADNVGISAFDLVLHQWSRLEITADPAIKHPPFVRNERWGHSATIASEFSETKVFLYGGWDSRCQYSDMYLLDLLACTMTEVPFTGTSPHCRAGHTTVAVGNHLVVFGGAFCAGGPYKLFNDMWIFSIQSREWSEVTSRMTGAIPSPRTQHSAVLMPDGRTMLVLGGFDGAALLDEVYAVDLETLVWTKLSPHGTCPCLPLGNVPVTDFRVPAARFSAVVVPKTTCPPGRPCTSVIVQSALGTTMLEIAEGGDATWKYLGSAGNRDSPKVMCHAAAWWQAGKRMYIFGGSDLHSVFNTLHALCL
ncbi:transcriptional regulator [Pelomyxa schiedti]|nr:transcriptional regulator [Pelomyxa schiedti]